MKLCLDVGNTTIFGGIANNKGFQHRFRYNSQNIFSSDQFGLFLIDFLREKDISQSLIKQVAICSVVPQLDYSIIAACKKYIKQIPFILRAGVKTKLKIKYRDPLEAGADRIADAIAAANLYANQNIIIINFGTATTFTIVTAEREYLGGVIVPGLRLSMNVLQSYTALISPVEIIASQHIVGRSTKECVQNGLYFGHLSMIEGIVSRIKEEAYKNKECITLATGGFAHLFAKEKLFTALEPDLGLLGLLFALQMNHNDR